MNSSAIGRWKGCLESEAVCRRSLLAMRLVRRLIRRQSAGLYQSCARLPPSRQLIERRTENRQGKPGSVWGWPGQATSSGDSDLQQQEKVGQNRAKKGQVRTAAILSPVTLCRLKGQFACQRQFIFLRLGVEWPRSLGKKFNRVRRAGIVKAKEKNL